MAKPTTAAALAVCAVVYVIVAGKFRLRFLWIPLVVAGSLLLVSALVIDGSVIVFVNRMRAGVEFMKSMEGQSALITRVIRVDENIGLRVSSKVILIVATGLISIYAGLSLSRVRWIALIVAATAVLLALATVAIASGFGPSTASVSRFAGLLVPVAAATILVGLVLSRVKGFLQISRSQWACALCFLVQPSVYALGTSESTWAASPHAALFWILASLVLISPATRNPRFASLLLSLALAVQVLTVVRIQNGIEKPYRQPQSLWANDYVMDIGRRGSTLILSRGFGQYFAQAIELSRRGGFAAGTPMIDLTGQSPGILYAVGAKSVGLPCMLGGYRGSDIVAVNSLKMVPCAELGTAWLLTEPDGPRQISPSVVASFGANLATDFELVGTFKTAAGAGGYEIERQQQFLKPIRPADAATAACVAIRTPMR